MSSPLYVNEPGDLIAAIPPMLGFRPSVRWFRLYWRAASARLTSHPGLLR
jgi:hypothetical protein